jgi:SAM-dependent methyltransferase
VPSERLLAAVERYYTGKVAEHGARPEGVDWNDAASQANRFAQLVRVADGRERFSLVDYGCGYGALVDFLEEQGRSFDYTGVDLSEAMLEHAQAAHPGRAFTGSAAEVEPADFAVASGVFNVRLDADTQSWTAYVLETIAELDRLGSAGFAFNMLTSYADPDRMRDDLYYGDPLFFFDHCKRTHARNVALLHDYGLWEFTLLVRKDVA